MWKLNHKQGRVPKNWCFQTLVLEETLESPLGSKEIKPVNPKGNQPWTFIGRTDAEAWPIRWPPDAKNWLIRKRSWCWERLRAGERDDRGWDVWMTSPTQGTWIWPNFERQQRTGKPGMQQSMELQRVQHDWVPKPQQIIYRSRVLLKENPFRRLLISFVQEIMHWTEVFKKEGMEKCG